jgi:hypothetical protein
MLPDSPDVEAVALGDAGIVAHAAAGTLLIDMSSIRPDVARRLAAAGADRGIRVLDAPVSGGEQGAIEATLSIMVGGTADDFATALPVLEAHGKTVVHVGPAGSAQTVKAPTSWLWQAPSSSSPRPSCSCGPTARTPRPPSGFWPVAWPVTRSWTARPPGCSREGSSRDSGSSCITRTSAS